MSEHPLENQVTRVAPLGNGITLRIVAICSAWIDTRSAMALGLPPGRRATGIRGASGYQARRADVKHHLRHSQGPGVVLHHPIDPAAAQMAFRCWS